ncbi:succinate dehydrogenase assembly factor 2 [Candidatus Erwinia haradaeae]|uniref:FAD assembly factor SdhE n=1 Tax=Candidatus Erwinia haradaeae TaxID=1922217 RepID=A0A451DA56_9GAMM|nr:succinate dehydrogenase assembly factor 2 [Candidatus Erwinia haradaeae]VFP83214.1 FAD assembly factor SdhE [Candidatus Erwinia haradaeae]
MDITDKSRIHLACYRGMRELDLLIMPFFQYEFDTLSVDEKNLFVYLLEHDDPQLLRWLINSEVPEDVNLKKIIERIQQSNQYRLP